MEQSLPMNRPAAESVASFSLITGREPVDGFARFPA
jgi:hypothetical protein